MIRTATPVPVRAPLNRWGNTAIAFGATGILLSWMPWVGVLGVLLALAGVVFGSIGLVQAPRRPAVLGLMFSVAAIASPFLIYSSFG